VAGKKKLNVLAYSTDPEYGAPYGARVVLAADDPGVCTAALRILAEAQPSMMLIHFPGVDRAGHAGEWDGYLGALHAVDSLVAEIWSFLRADPDSWGKTLFFITNDHGRHLDTVSTGFIGHGNDCDGCRHLMLFGAGGGLSRGYVCPLERTQRDIAPSIGEWLRVPTPNVEGMSLLGDTLRTVGARP
jgi:bisphosphoglycerate-independent phosphoglycerate mutase (AlkP superfamily)